jgi:hypothetical protein
VSLEQVSRSLVQLGESVALIDQAGPALDTRSLLMVIRRSCLAIASEVERQLEIEPRPALCSDCGRKYRRRSLPGGSG